MSGRTVSSPAELSNLVGTESVGEEWLTIDQGRIDAFAGATSDFQWIHVDPERAAAGPFGATVAHGYLTLSLIPVLTEGVLDVRGVGATVNYGLDKVRFPSPVHVGARVRMSATIVEAEEVPGGVQLSVDQVIEVEGGQKPAVVARGLYRFYE